MVLETHMNGNRRHNVNREFYFFSFAYRYFMGKAYLSFTENAADSGRCA